MPLRDGRGISIAATSRTRENGTIVSEITTPFEHEHLSVVTGRRSGLVIAVAVHSTVLGPALGGCRVWNYPSWQDAVDDALRLSQGMTFKNALAGLDAGGGKAVIHLPIDERLEDERRRAAFLDLGDLVEQLGGRYRTAEDVGVTSADMAVVAEQTAHVVGLPPETGGHGDPARHTAHGVYAAIRETLRRMDGSGAVAGRRMTIAGLGHVGSSLAEQLAAEGAVLTVCDVNPERRELAERLGAAWVEPAEAHRVEADVFIPAGVGGMLSPTVIEELAARAVVGPANNQLLRPDGAEQLAARGIVYAPDFLVNAGGVIFLDAPVDLPRARLDARLDGIADTLRSVFDVAEREGATTVEAASRIVAERLARARTDVHV
ncbi:Glu/Leu/Phe/Val dehydrogenase family protein [Microbacterium sp. MEC084]|nr:Glu/Leu/Phe/Val dehydrogenase family protein [Microbacterium sp. MEC084]